MENASKALLMAGGMLLAILLISVGVLGYSKIKSFKTTEAEISAKKQVQAFNAEYESYNRKLLRGIDVISVVNKAANDNKKQEMEIKIKIYILEEDVYKKIENIEEIEYFKTKVFTCTEVKYNDEGKVYEMTFKEKK